jgi:hypothetical protein
MVLQKLCQPVLQNGIDQVSRKDGLFGDNSRLSGCRPVFFASLFTAAGNEQPVCAKYCSCRIGVGSRITCTQV